MSRALEQAVRQAAVVAAFLLIVPPAWSADRHRGCHRRCVVPFLYDHRGFDGVPLIPPERRVYGLPREAAPEYEPQEVPGPSPSPGRAPYAQGFVLDVPVTPRLGTSDKTAHPATLSRYPDVAAALSRCWQPPDVFGGRRWQQATLRVSFRRDGTVNGTPLVPFVGGGLTAQAQSDLKSSLLAALHSCTPLPLTPALGGAIAGQIFALRFIEQDQTR